MEFILNYWYIILAVLAVITAGVCVAVRFLKLPSEKQLAKVREWLLYAVTEAEKALGGGTGKLKLRYVYDLFLSKFTWVAKLISFDTFSALVDDALGEMRNMLNTNEQIAVYVASEKQSE